jgi:hypothetical protein
MSYANFQHERKMDYILHEVNPTGDYTAKVGTAAYKDGLFDNPIVYSDPAADATLTVPDGAYVGQTLMITLESNEDSKTLTITTTTGTDFTMATAGYHVLIVWTGATSGWVKVAGTTTT